MSQPSHKRAPSDTFENANQNKRGKHESHDVKNVTFLSLPREIRQKILTKVLADALAEDFALMDILTYFRFELQHPSHFHPTRNHVKIPHLSDAASTLAKVHSTIATDLPYVLDKQLAQIEGYYDNWNASSSIWDYKETEFWQAKAPRWIELMYFYEGGGMSAKQRTRYVHQILASIDPADAGCWKRFKLHTSWFAGSWWDASDESDQEDNEAGEAGKQLHIDSKCDCDHVTKK